MGYHLLIQDKYGHNKRYTKALKLLLDPVMKNMFSHDGLQAGSLDTILKLKVL